MSKLRIAEISSTTGTGSITLSGALNLTFQTFSSSFSVGDRIEYCIKHINNTEFEVVIGTLTSATTLTRDKVVYSTNSNALVNFTTGTKTIFFGPTANNFEVRHPFPDWVTNPSWDDMAMALHTNCLTLPILDVETILLPETADFLYAVTGIVTPSGWIYWFSPSVPTKIAKFHPDGYYEELATGVGNGGYHGAALATNGKIYAMSSAQYGLIVDTSNDNITPIFLGDYYAAFYSCVMGLNDKIYAPRYQDDNHLEITTSNNSLNYIVQSTGQQQAFRKATLSPTGEIVASPYAKTYFEIVATGETFGSTGGTTGYFESAVLAGNGYIYVLRSWGVQKTYKIHARDRSVEDITATIGNYTFYCAKLGIDGMIYAAAQNNLTYTTGIVVINPYTDTVVNYIVTDTGNNKFTMGLDGNLYSAPLEYNATKMVIKVKIVPDDFNVDSNFFLSRYWNYN